MAIAYHELALLPRSDQFLRRVRMAVVLYAVEVMRSGYGGATGRDWATGIITGATVEAWVQRLLPYLLDAAVGGATTGEGATLDVDATDAALSTVIQQQIAVLVGE